MIAHVRAKKLANLLSHVVVVIIDKDKEMKVLFLWNARIINSKISEVEASGNKSYAMLCRCILLGLSLFLSTPVNGYAVQRRSSAIRRTLRP